jgi:hypothetical protein
MVLAFDPGTARWRRMATTPYSPPWGGAWAWTGSDLIVVGGGDEGSDETTQSWAFDPGRDEWRRLPDMPVAVNLASATWTGNEVVVVGSEIDGRNHASTRTAVAAAYDPSLDAWRRLADPPVSAQTSDVDQLGQHLVAWEPYSPAAAVFVRSEDRWRSVDTGALEGHECYADGVVVGGTLVSWSCGDPAELHPDTLAWVEVDPPLPPGPRGIAFSVGSVFPAGDVAVVAQIETIIAGGDVAIGDVEAPRHLWAWRPASEAVGPPQPTVRDAEYLVGTFLAEWEPGWEAYLPTRATQSVIELMREGGAGMPAFEDGAVAGWDTEPAVVIDEGVFEVPVGVTRDHQLVASLVFTVGPGTTADGRSGQLVIVEVRATDRSAAAS